MPENRLPAGVAVLERGWLSSNSIVITGGAGLSAVIDSGYWTHAAQTVALVGQALDDRPLDLLINTHLHSDHCGGNAALQEAWPEVQTCIPPGLAAAVQQWDPVALSYEPTGQHCPHFRFDAVARPGAELQMGARLWEVHGAPGHDPHSVVLFEPASRTLVSADALWENGFGIVFPELDGDEGFAEVAATLDAIDALHPAVVVPGHGAVFSDVDAALARARRRLAGLAADPAKHAAHATKVLLKFKLLELQETAWADFLAWATAMPYLDRMRGRFFPDTPAREWIVELVAQLERSGAAARRGERIGNA